MSHRAITINAIILGLSTIGSYTLGLVRDRLLASQFGAGSDLDIFNSSFIIPDFIINLFAAALTTAFIPVLVQLRYQSQVTMWKTMNSMLSLISSCMLGAILLAWIFMPQLTQLVAPGFNDQQHQLLTHTTRILLISPFLFSLSTVFGSTLQSLERFMSYAISPLLYNIGIVLGIVLLAPQFGITGVIIGVVTGAGLHMLVRLIEVWRSGWRWQWSTHWQDPAIRQTVWLMLPRIIGLLSVQVNLWTYNAVGSTLASGSISVFNLARNFQSLPVSLFGIALATAAFPVLSAAYVQANHDEFTRQLSWTLRQILFFTLPASVGMIALAQVLITTVLGSGAFSATAIVATSITLTMFALSIPIESVLHVAARAFYARHNTITPVLIAVLGMLINLVVCWLVAPTLGASGLALAFVCTALTQVALLFYWLQRKRLYTIDRTVFITFAKSGLGCITMGIVVILITGLDLSALPTLLIGAMVGAIVYIAVALALHMPEVHTLKKIIIQRLWRSN